MALRAGSRRRQTATAAPGGDAQTAALRDAYEAVPYPGAAFPQTHPDRLATIATLFGGRPAPVATCRVLELGCGDGGNLLPLAHAMPEATFVGLDLSPSAIARATAAARELGLRNVELRTADLAAEDPRALGRFDHVIAHGVFSWVPDPVREALLVLVRACLEREGTAFLSFNALPGGHLRAVVNDAMRWHARDATTPDERLAAARAMARRLQAQAGSDGPLRREIDHAVEREDPGIVHDALADPSDAFLVTDVAGRAAAHSLRFLAEADLHTGVDGAQDDLARELDALGGDRLAREQYLDLLVMRAYREAVLVRDDARARGGPSVGTLHALRAAAQLEARPAKRGIVRFEGPKGGALTTDHPAVQETLRTIAARWPASVPVAELPAAEPVHDALLGAHVRGLVELRTWDAGFTTEVLRRPVVAAPARLRVGAGERLVTTLRHTTVELDDEGRRLVALCDGTRDLPALADALGLDDRGRGELRGRLERVAALALLESA